MIVCILCLCFVFCVLCSVFCVLCFVFCVLCFVFYVLCFVFCKKHKDRYGMSNDRFIFKDISQWPPPIGHASEVEV